MTAHDVEHAGRARTLRARKPCSYGRFRPGHVCGVTCRAGDDVRDLPPRRTEAPAPTSGTGSLDSRSDDRRLAIPRATGCGGQPAGRQGRTVQRLLVTTPWFAPTDQMWPGHHD